MSSKTTDSVGAYLLLHDAVTSLRKAIKLPELYEWNKVDLVLVEDAINHLTSTMLEMPLGGFLKDRVFEEGPHDEIVEDDAPTYRYSINIEYVGLDDTATYYVVLDHLYGDSNIMQRIVESMRKKEVFLLSDHFALASDQRDEIINGGLIASACVAQMCNL